MSRLNSGGLCLKRNDALRCDDISYSLTSAVTTSASTLPPIRMPMIHCSPRSGNSTAAVRITDSITSAATTAPVNRFSLVELIQGPRM